MFMGAITLDLFAVLLGGAEALLPIFAADILRVGLQGLGILRGAHSAGAVAMSLYLSHRRPMERPGRALFYAVGGFGLCMIRFGLSRIFLLVRAPVSGGNGRQRQRADPFVAAPDPDAGPPAGLVWRSTASSSAAQGIGASNPASLPAVGDRSVGGI
jgi:hypothetical protein